MGPWSSPRAGEAGPWVLRPSPAGAHGGFRAHRLVSQGAARSSRQPGACASPRKPTLSMACPPRDVRHLNPPLTSAPTPRDTAPAPPSSKRFRLYSTSLPPTGSLPDPGRHSVVAARLVLQMERQLRATSLGHRSLSPSKVSGHELLWGLSRGSLMHVCRGTGPSRCWAGGARFSLQGINVGP